MEVEYVQEEELVFISEGGDAAFSVDQLAGPPAASVAAIDDPFYVATSDDPDSFEHDKERSGVVHMAGIVGHGATTWTIVFQFDDGSVISASAALPQLGDGRPGEGAGTVHGGAGRFRGARGDFQVRVKNPHRWSLTI